MSIPPLGGNRYVICYQNMACLVSAPPSLEAQSSRYGLWGTIRP